MSFDPIAYLNEPRWQESRLGLERIERLMELMGNPQNNLRFVHVAGTNGKGSTCSFLSAALTQAGYTTGLFTSPYIHEFEERIRVNGSTISREDLTEVTIAVKEQADKMQNEECGHPTEFELMTAVALVHFANQGCDIVVLEVGLGGRLDSTNIIAAPEVAVITSIGLDHTALLGNTVEEIAAEKAGIIKQGTTVVSCPQIPEAQDVINKIAAQNQVEVVVPDSEKLDIGSVQVEEFEGKQRYVRPFTYRGKSYSTRMVGLYQPKNAAVALEVIALLNKNGWEVPEEAVSAGLAQVVCPGRFEVVPRAQGEPQLIIDGGHNPQGAQAFAETMADVFPGKKVVFVLSMLEDKDYPRMLETILPLGSSFITVAAPNPRALSAYQLARAVRWTGQDLLGCSACVNPFEARSFEAAVEKLSDMGEDGIICLFGSLYSIAAFRQAWGVQ